MNLPEESKIWIFQSTRNFNGEELKSIESRLDEFMKNWNAHGDALTAAYAIPYDRFIVVAVDENIVPASGCSIDSLTRVIKAIEADFNFGLLNRMLVSYGLNDEIITLPLSEFKEKVRQNELPMDASVFHNGVSNLRDFEEAWELPLAESWVSVLLNQSPTI